MSLPNHTVSIFKSTRSIIIIIIFVFIRQNIIEFILKYSIRIGILFVVEINVIIMTMVRILVHVH